MVAAVLGILAAWLIVTQRKLVHPRLLVRPELVVTRLFTKIREGERVTQLLASLQRDLLGFTLGSLLGLVVGALMGVSTIYERLLGPSFHAAKQVALFAWSPLMSVWLGTGELAKVAFIALSAFYSCSASGRPRITLILVTHDVDEAVYRGDRVVVMQPRPGRIRRLIDVDVPHPRERANPLLKTLGEEVRAEIGDAARN